MVTVIIPMYNSENTIGRAIKSVLNQSLEDKIQLFIINDGSSDCGKKVVEDIIKDNQQFDIQLINQENGGVSKARNTGLKLARGEWIAFLDADDMWNKDKLEKQLSFTREYAFVDLLGCVFSSEHYRFRNPAQAFKLVSLKSMLFKNFFQPSTVIMKRDVLESIGFFKEDQKYAEEGNYFIRIAAKGFNCVLQNQKLITFGFGKSGFGQSGLSSNLIGMEKGELANINFAFNNKLIKFDTYLLAIIYSFLKFGRRLVLVKFRKNA